MQPQSNIPAEAITAEENAEQIKLKPEAPSPSGRDELISSSEEDDTELINLIRKKRNYKALILLFLGCTGLWIYILSSSRLHIENIRQLFALVFAFALTYGLTYLLYWSEKNLCKQLWIKVGKDGIEFCDDWSFELLKRLKRPWSDLQSVDTISVSFKKKPFLMTKEMFDLTYGTKILFYFSSGGNTAIRMSRLTPQDKIRLFRALERHIPLTKLSGAAIRLKEEAYSEISGASYTELWNDDIAMRHASTHFMPLPSGHQLQSGKLRVVAELASGGLSAIYLVESADHKSKLVLKESVLPLDMSEESKTKARELFQREAKILAALDHPNIVKVHDCFVERGRDYLVLQHIPGRTLRQLVGENVLPPDKAIKMALQIADIVSYLHQQQPPVVHRDLTPDNILVTGEGEIFLIDFGAANQFIGQATGTMIGKKSYIAPEQFRGKAQPASDVYAFGATMYFMLVGKDPLALSTNRPDASLGIPQAVCDLLEKCTQLEVLDRINDIETVQRELIAIAGGA